MGYAETNAFARQVCGLPPGYHAAMAVVDQNRKSFRGDTADITFMGFDLVVEMDYQGYVEGVQNAKDGTDCMSMFSDWALAEIKTLAHLAQMEEA